MKDRSNGCPRRSRKERTFSIRQQSNGHEIQRQSALPVEGMRGDRSLWAAGKAQQICDECCSPWTGNRADRARSTRSFEVPHSRRPAPLSRLRRNSING